MSVSNAGAGTLTGSISIESSSAGIFTLIPRQIDLSLAAGASKTFTVQFKPKRKRTSYTGAVIITSNDPDEATVEIPLTGTGM